MMFHCLLLGLSEARGALLRAPSGTWRCLLQVLGMKLGKGCALWAKQGLELLF